MEKSGYLEVSEAFGIVMLFPQTMKWDKYPHNPNSWWDFLGDNKSFKLSRKEDGDFSYFRTKKRKQVAADWNIINDLVVIANTLDVKNEDL